MATLLARGARQVFRTGISTTSLLFAKPTCGYLLSTIRNVGSTSRSGLSPLDNRLSSLNKPRAFKYDALPPDQVAVNALKSASCDPLQVWETSVRDGHATVSTAVLCMSAYLSTLQSLPQEEIKRKVEIDKPGKKLLLWLWSPGQASPAMYQRRLEDFLNSYAFQYELCYLLVEENDEEYLWSWMATDAGVLDRMDAGDSAKRIATKQHLWRGFMFRQIMAVKLDQAIAYGTHSADEAIKAFWRAENLKRAKRHENSPPQDSLKLASLKPAILLLAARMPTPSFTKTTAAAWDGVRKFMSTLGPSLPFVGTFHGNDMGCAKLDIWHPVRPDTTLALEIIAAFRDGAAAPGIVPNGESGRLFLTFLGDVVRVLRAQGQVAKAEEINDLHRKLLKEWGYKFSESRGNKKGAVLTRYHGSKAAANKRPPL